MPIRFLTRCADADATPDDQGEQKASGERENAQCTRNARKDAMPAFIEKDLSA